MVYAPSIQGQVWPCRVSQSRITLRAVVCKALALIIDRLVEVDVEIKLDEHMDEEDVFAMEDDEDPDAANARTNEMADKLDAMLKLVYQVVD